MLDTSNNREFTITLTRRELGLIEYTLKGLYIALIAMLQSGDHHALDMIRSSMTIMARMPSLVFTKRLKLWLINTIQTRNNYVCQSMPISKVSTMSCN